MPKKKIIILGGGISGLTLAYELAKKSDRYQIELIEKSDHLGGWIDTDTSTGFFFEKGPRVFRGSKSPNLLSLTEEIGLQSELIESKKEGQGINLLIDGKMRKIPIFSWDLVRGIIKDLRTPSSTLEDESVWDFARRRFNETVAFHIFDPLVIGIYGGSMKEISASSCFPAYVEWEQKYGSVLKGMLKRERFRGPVMFGFQRGMKSVVQRIYERTPIVYRMSEEVQAIHPKESGFIVKTSKNSYEADYLFSALPANAIGKLLIPELAALPMEGTTLVNLGYRKNILKRKGFGYIVSSQEKEDVMGVIFNSNTFPQCNHLPEETRITVKLKKGAFSDPEARSIAMKALEKHLKIKAVPDVSMVIQAPQVFPQYVVGHKTKMQTLVKELQEKYPRLRLVGNYLFGVGVDSCVAIARSVSASFLSENES